MADCSARPNWSQRKCGSSWNRVGDLGPILSIAARSEPRQHAGQDLRPGILFIAEPGGAALTGPPPGSCAAPPHVPQVIVLTSRLGTGPGRTGRRRSPARSSSDGIPTRCCIPQPAPSSRGWHARIMAQFLRCLDSASRRAQSGFSPSQPHVFTHSLPRRPRNAFELPPIHVEPRRESEAEKGARMSPDCAPLISVVAACHLGSFAAR